MRCLFLKDKNMGIYFALFLILIAADQWIKLWAMRSLMPVGSIRVLPFLSLTYVENRGAAFGLLQGQRWILSAVSIAVVILCLVCLVRNVFHTKAANLCVTLVAAGGAGNLIDRLLRGYVVDYLDINALFPYPMFNLADCCVVVGAVLFVILTLLSERKGKASGGPKGTLK